MNHQVILEDLKKVIAVKDMPEEHLQWIVKHSRYEEFNDGDIILKTGDPIDEMSFILEGKMNFYLDTNGQTPFLFCFENDELTGGLTGKLPYSRMNIYPGTSIAVGKLRLLWLNEKYFHELEQLNSGFIQRLIGYMTERARYFATTKLQQEKVSALGKLAAGVAHELNNPAAAISRISEELEKRLNRNLDFTEDMLKYNISPEHVRNIRNAAIRKEKDREKNIKLTPLQRMQNEDDLNDWLSDKGFGSRNEMAETFAESGFIPDDLEKILEDVPDSASKHLLEWFENLLSSGLILKDLDYASDRISLLVGAIKSHVQMDRSEDMHITKIHEDLDNTLILLGYKLRDKGIEVKKIYCDNLPDIEAYTGELNQVWTNLIDNAIYAVPQNGEIKIQTECDEKNVTVKIMDNGTGIPKEIITRIFDPFFTSKKVGEGTGIGLDIVKTVVKSHKGDVKVKSEPGKTEFVVTIPISQNSKKEK